MCGIVGVLAIRPAAPIILEALRRLEYRGYDSAGIAAVGTGGLDRRRSPGKLASLTALLGANPLNGHSGIGHTRWATHGLPNEANAHPHRAGPVAVVHNGIIENHLELRHALVAEGWTFESETDSEVIAVQCASFVRRGLGHEEAAAATIARLRGAYALCLIFEGQDNLMICARRGSPLVIGFGDGEAFVGSDALALAGLATRISYLEEGDWAVLTRDSVRIHDADGHAVEREVQPLSLETVLADKGQHRHFMAKEIHEQPATTARALGAWLAADRLRIDGPVAGLDWAGMDRLTVVGCGTAYLAGLVARSWFERIAGLPLEIDIASEFRYREPPLTPKGAAILISQSGETADTLAALRYARAAGQRILGLVNVTTSTIARESDVVLPIHAGPEIGVASTKAFTAQLVALAALAVLAGRLRGRIDADEEARLVAELCSVPRLVAETLACEPQIADLAREIAEARDVLYLGRGSMYPLALEGALKLKEITYIHAEGYAAGELKHGPIALVDEHTPVVALMPTGPLLEKTMSNLREVGARRGRLCVFTDMPAEELDGDPSWRVVKMSAAGELSGPLCYAVAVQLLAYHAAVCRGTDVDQPRNLAKSVTVE